MTRTICMYTIYTDSHNEMYDRFFVPSVPDSFELIAVEHGQDCPTGEYFAQGWAEAMLRKVETIREAIEHVRNTDGPDYFVFSDCDIQYFADVSAEIDEHMKTKDFVAMDDGILCFGFLGIRADSRSAFMWKWIAENVEKYGSDQDAGNVFIRKHERALRIGRFIPTFLQPPSIRRHTRAGPIRFGLFPRVKYFNYMHLGTSDPVWDGKVPIRVSDEQLDSMMMVHGNYTIGIENKIRLLETVSQLKADRESNKKPQSQQQSA
jgi:hypothetical protein